MTSFRLTGEDFARYAIVGELVEQTTVPPETREAVDRFGTCLTEALVEQHEYSDVLNVLLLPGNISLRVDVEDEVLHRFLDAIETLEQRDNLTARVTPAAVLPTP